MKRPIPIWPLAALPASLAGHALAYLVTGQSLADGRHAYFSPLLEGSAAALLALGLAMLLAATTRDRRAALFGVETTVERALVVLAPLQMLIFWGLERTEGYTPSPASYAIQVLVAAVVALALASYGQLFRRAVHAACEAELALRRIFCAPPAIGRLALAVACSDALAVHAGHKRFQRPPPLAAVR